MQKTHSFCRDCDNKFAVRPGAERREAAAGREGRDHGTGQRNTRTPKAFDHRIFDLDKEIVSTAKRTGAQVRGPIRCRPRSKSLQSTARRMSTRNRASSSKSEPDKRVLDIVDPTPQTVERFDELLDLAAAWMSKSSRDVKSEKAPSAFCGGA